MKSKKKEIKPFEYEVEDFTPGFIFAVVITVALMVGLLILFSLIVASGAVAVSEVLNG